jgi:hypothetical protein
MSKRTNQAAWVLAATLAVAILLLGARHFRFREDCADMPPLQVFANVFGHPPPPGLWDIRAAGRIWLGGRNVYLRFSATDDAIRSLTRGSQRVVGAQSIHDCIASTRMGLQVPGDARSVRWKVRVRWDQIDRIKRPECYALSPHAPCMVPDITLIVDRSRHLVYVYLFDI